MLQKPLVAICFSYFAVAATAQEAPMPILFTNVNVFDGVSETLIEDANVLVTGNLILEVSSEPLAVANSRIIDGGGRTLMPGIIEAHGHLGQAVLPTQVTGSEDWQYMASLSTFAAKYYLDRGWTTVRDAGGPTFSKRDAALPSAGIRADRHASARRVRPGKDESDRVHPAGSPGGGCSRALP